MVLIRIGDELKQPGCILISGSWHFGYIFVWVSYIHFFLLKHHFSGQNYDYDDFCGIQVHWVYCLISSLFYDRICLVLNFRITFYLVNSYFCKVLCFMSIKCLTVFEVFVIISILRWGKFLSSLLVMECVVNIRCLDFVLTHFFLFWICWFSMLFACHYIWNKWDIIYSIYFSSSDRFWELDIWRALK